MGKYSTYGMTGVGIAAAIGFVFALTILNSANPLDDAKLARHVETQPYGASSFLFDKQDQVARDGEQAGSSDSQLKQQDEAADASSSQQEMTLFQETAESRPLISSVIAVNGTTGEVIAQVVPGSPFTIGKPYFIQAHFNNPNETAVLDHTVVMILIRNGTAESGLSGTVLEEAANFRGDIGGNENVNLEFYWNPDVEGDYSLRVFSLTASDLLEGESAEPILAVSIQAVISQ